MFLMRDCQSLDTDLNNRSESVGNRRKISLRRPSIDKTLCTEKGKSCKNKNHVTKKN